ncbi:cell cycle arrest protein BUB2 [Cryptococcus gattii E566]|uniref:Cell cycle arrest protein BUB2 n=2 Tax=Cryptococcus gattii TaxID=37769 RepID=A0ABR5BLX9_9TREE|nr:Mitotic exit network regulator, putative; Bub2p [Cryptococcus gattii WM276]ADV25121.1 Mitotic exit network regulator, putative; Bub2p [Cryptococcus gattii WM276]KIR76663.1 cell cycle arrest protein BUB2 [Cryptococcus gattii EJB2]KIY31678.1 cell cycle arrest protein BUB2 [Cryptococcus gattii E566]KJE00125.1 cell cycle arrest protein BUB2 [Cryptococcus gattii NT-10]
MSTSTEIYDSLHSILSYPLISRHRSSSEISDGLKRIRRIVLTEGIPEVSGRAPLRPRIWKLMLKVDSLQTEDYLRWVSMGPSSDSQKIKNDTFRTLATDTQFKGKVKEDMLIRLLEAFVWKITCTHAFAMETEDESQPFKYVQGMNVLSAPFLFTMPSQLEAFQCFSTFIENGCPLYVQPSLKGVHKGLTLLDRCLEVVDPELYNRLASKNLKAEIYAFPSVMTLCACTPPLEEVLRLWDFLLAFGLHLNILCVIAQLLLIRQDLMDSFSPMKILRTFPPLDARPVIGVTVALVKDIPEELYRELVAHPFSC